MIKNKIELIVPYTIFFLITTVLVLHPINEFGHFVYMLDDAYIHLAFSENLAKYGKASADSFSLSNPSSSPLWSLILFIFYKIDFLQNTYQYIPLTLNILFSIFSIYYFNEIVKNVFNNINRIKLIVINSFFVLAVPLPVLSIMGMEHSIQLLLTLLFVNTIMHRHVNLIKITIISILLVMTRYEMSIFIGASFLFDYIFFRKGKEILFKYVLIMVLASIPITIYGLTMKFLYHLSFFPDSIISKLNDKGGKIIDIIQVLNQSNEDYIIQLFFFLSFTYFSILLVSILIFRKKVKEKKILFITLTAATMSIFQLLFSGLCPIRYEAYLVPLLVIMLFDLLFFSKSNIIKVGISGLLFIMVISKVIFPLITGYYGTINIYDQQILNSDFVNTNKIKTVALNDLGTISFFTNAKIIDLEGLGTHSIAKMKENGTYTSKKVRKEIIDNNTDWMIIYDSWYKNENIIPPKCIKIGKTIMKNNYICGSNEVDYYYCGNNTKKAKMEFDNFKTFVNKKSKGMVTAYEK